MEASRKQKLRVSLDPSSTRQKDQGRSSLCLFRSRTGNIFPSIPYTKQRGKPFFLHRGNKIPNRIRVGMLALYFNYSQISIYISIEYKNLKKILKNKF